MEEEKDEADDETKRELFVGNLSFQIDEDTLASHFEKYGEITNIKIPQKDGRSKGIAFIEFATSKIAKKALDGENGKQLDGRALKLNFSGEKPENGFSP